MTISGSSITKKLFIAVLVIFVIVAAKEFLMPLSIGIVIATLFMPISNWFERKKISRGISSLLCLLILIAFLIGVSLLISMQVSLLANDFDLLKDSTIKTSERIQEKIFSQYGLSIGKQNQLVKTQVTTISSIIPYMASSITSALTNLILTLVYVFCFLYYRSHLKQFILKLASSQNETKVEELLYKVTHVSQQYLFGLSKMILCLWIMYGIGFSIIGIKNAWFYAILCGLLEIVPFIGNITGTAITTLIAAVQGGSSLMLISIIITYGIVQFIQGWILEPFIVGAQVKINPLFTIIALIIGELLWGIPGIFLAIPLIAMFKVLCENIDQLKPLGFLISEIETKPNSISIISKIKNWINAKRNI